jgi:hypothetical protein
MRFMFGGFLLRTNRVFFYAFYFYPHISSMVGLRELDRSLSLPKYGSFRILPTPCACS